MSSLIVRSHSYQYELLLAAIRGGDLIYIDGMPSVGKTTLATVALESMGHSYLYAKIDCNEITTCTKLYTKISMILKSKANLLRFDNKNTDRISSASDFNTFMERFKERASKKGYERIYVILDQVEFFKKTSMMDAIVVLTKNLHMNTILISNEPLQRLLECMRSLSQRVRLRDRATMISLGPWTKNDLVEVICLQSPKRFADFYESFVHNIVSLVYKVESKNVNDLRMLCQESFEGFVEHHRRNVTEELRKENELEIEDTDIDISDSELEESYPPERHAMTTFISSHNNWLQRSKGIPKECLAIDRKVNVEVTIMIVAMYIAANTKASDDKNNFVKLKKRGTKRARKEDNPDKMGTIRPFTLERAIQIYYCLSKMSQGSVATVRDDCLDSVLSDIQLLEDINFISKCRGDGISSTTRYEISPNLSQEYVTFLADTVEVKLEEMCGLDPKAHRLQNREDQSSTL